MAFSLSRLTRPNTVTIFANDPTSYGKIVAFVLERVAVPGKKHVSLDLVHTGNGERTYSITRNPVERVVASNIRREPERLTISGSLSATPLGVAAAIGTLGSVVRLDLRRLAKLHDLFDAGEPLIVVTPWRSYPNMAGRSISEQHPGGGKVDLTLAFEEMRIVDPLLVAGVTDLAELLAGATSDAQLGGQATETITAPAGVAGGLG